MNWTEFASLGKKDDMLCDATPASREKDRLDIALLTAAYIAAGNHIAVVTSHFPNKAA